MKTGLVVAAALLVPLAGAQAQTKRTWEYALLTTVSGVPDSWSWGDSLRAFNVAPVLAMFTAHEGQALEKNVDSLWMPARSVRVPQGVKLDSARRVPPPLGVFLNDVGAKGWELVSATANNDRSSYVFKRELTSTR